MPGIACPQCGAENPKANRFCDTCGVKLASAAEEPKAAAKEAKGPGRAAAVAAAPRKRAEEDAPFKPLLAQASGGALLGGIDANKLWWFLIVAFGAFLRLWALGAKPLHHDESIHAWYAYKLFQGEGYLYDPAYHGPFRYHMTALMFFLFGDSDFTARILPAGVGIFGLIFLWRWRGMLGEKGALFAAAMMAISPTWTYDARFLRDDITMAVGCLVVVWGLFNYFETRLPRYLFWAVGGFVASYTSHEGTWIFMGIMGSYLGIRWMWERSEAVEPEYADVTGLVSALMPQWYAPRADAAGGAAALLVLVLGLASKAWTGPGVIICGLLVAYAVTALAARLLFFGSKESRWLWRGLLAVFFIPFSILYSTGFTNLDGWFKGAFDSIAYWLGEQKTGRADQPWQFYLYLLGLYELAICFFAAFGGLRLYFGSGKAKFFFLKILAFFPFVFAIFLLINYPKDPIMVPVMAVFAVIGGGCAAWSSFEQAKGNHFKTFLLYWSMLALIMFTIAGERMPWLTLHPLTPLTLLAALYLDDFFSRDEANLAEHWLAWAILALPLAVLAILLPRQLAQAAVQAPREIVAWLQAFATGDRYGSFQVSSWADNVWGNTFVQAMIASAFVALAIIIPLLGLSRWPHLKNWTRGIFVGLCLLGLATLSHGTMNLCFKGDGADPREQEVYVQSSVELPEVAAKLDRMSRALTGGPYLKIAVEDSCSWPMSWYLRRMPNAQIGFGAPLTMDKVPNFPVIMTGADDTLSPNHDQVVADSLGNSYTAYPVDFRRWWAPDKNAFFQGSATDQANLLWRLYMYREPWMPAAPIVNPRFSNYVYPKADSIGSPFGSFDAYVWVRKDVDRYFQ
ncbi:MAG TPA: flippase activity-associated protein Agl23 [bacterium]|jgi:uncharacterized protein (TIGR03663 family)|nr:flippase activity-associated protein Agl23 [bacterium]